ncbi:MAG: hypothetical protein I3273_03735 [Candidatus Moeniiplasma glomeromycotorum]|nr:hypothetical protein [Candidatus Moeniiplasma glomeromycotorum]MCE8167958.1 hypothetical protein [Candidatus Moeniiplasma glomeromycotorum]MCE8169207.1 hypothetical protein [Candidatus Moeniiplasma glomeromycotorum]
MKKINQEIEKTFVEVDRIMDLLWREAKYHADNWKENTNQQAEKDAEKRLDHLFDTSRPPLNEEKRLSYSFYELKEMLTKIVNGLPGFVDEKGEINQKLLTSLISISTALEKLKSGEEKRITISGEPGDENFYELVKNLESSSEKERLEKELNDLKTLKEVLNNSFPNLIGSENKVNETVQKSMVEDLAKLKEIQQQTSTNPTSPEIGKESEIEAKIQGELDKANSVKIDNLSDKEFFDLLNKFKKMKNWILTGNEAESEASINKRSELKKVTDKLGLEAYRRRWKQKIDYALKDEYEEYESEEEEENHSEPIVLKNTDLTKAEYIDYETELRKKISKKELDNFGYKVVIDIYEQRPKHKYVIEVLNEGKEAIENKDSEGVNEVLTDLKFLEKTEKQVFRSKLIEINKLKRDINSFLIQSQQAQIIQNTK